MDLDGLEKLAKFVLKDLLHEPIYDGLGELQYSPDLSTKFRNLMKVSSKILPEHKELFSSAYEKADELSIGETCSLIRHLLEILEIERTSRSKIEKLRIFESAEEKLKQASLSFQKEDYSSTIHNLNTALELVLKKIRISEEIRNKTYEGL